MTTRPNDNPSNETNRDPSGGTIRELVGPSLDRLRGGAIAAAVAGAVLCAAGLVMNPRGFWHSWLFAFLFWWGVTVGSIAWLMLHHVVGGGWGFIIRRFLEAGSRLWWLAALFFLPIVVGLPNIYEWTHPHPGDAVLRAKDSYLNPYFFLARAAFYFLLWGLLATLLNRWGREQEENPGEKTFARLNYLGTAGILLYVLSVTFASVDWVMSIEPHWLSSIIGLLYVAGQGLSTMALMIWLVGFLGGRNRVVSEEVPKGYFRDLGNLLMAFVLLWAYMSYSQYVIIYSANIAEMASWYVHRARGGWGAVGILLLPLHFALPFLILLLGSRVKRDPVRMAHVAAFLIAMRFIDLFWWVAPTFRSHLSLTPSDFGAPLLMGGIWLLAWIAQVKERTVVPVRDPRLDGSWPIREVAHHG